MQVLEYYLEERVRLKNDQMPIYSVKEPVRDKTLRVLLLARDSVDEQSLMVDVLGMEERIFHYDQWVESWEEKKKRWGKIDGDEKIGYQSQQTKVL